MEESPLGAEVIITRVIATLAALKGASNLNINGIAEAMP
jgi:hypothetical protein